MCSSLWIWLDCHGVMLTHIHMNWTEEEGSVSVRSRAAGDEGAKALDAFVADILKEIETKENRQA